jgi:hypothetical protein
MNDDRDEIARHYGFNSYAELLDISDPLPKRPGEAQAYIARHARGHWFIWEDKPPTQSPSEPRYPVS